MFKSVAAAFVLVLASSGAGAADDAPPPAARPPLEALKSDPHVAKALEFIAVSGAKDVMLQQTNLLVDAMIAQMRKAKSDVPDQMWEFLRTTVEDEYRAESDDLLIASAKIYSDHFTDAELDQMIAFYKSDVGLKLLRERPAIIRESAALGQAWAARMQPIVMDKILKKLQSIGPVTKEQKS